MAHLIVTASISPSVVTAEAAMTERKIGVSAELATVTRTEDHDYYEGAVTFTPSDTTQTIATKNLVLADDITINPIPSNYGKITWNGSYLTVS